MPKTLRLAAFALAGGILVGVLIIAITAWVQGIADERENNRHINPAIYPAFREIENRCLKESFPHESVRCQTALKLLRDCANSSDSCPAENYYESLAAAGFDLPPFYEPGYKPK